MTTRFAFDQLPVSLIANKNGTPQDQIMLETWRRMVANNQDYSLVGNGWVDGFLFPTGINLGTSVNPYYNDTYTKLLLHCDGTNNSTTFTDSSPAANVITNVSTSITVKTAIKKFGTGSARISSGPGAGNSVALTAPAGANFDFGSSDFTIDFWIYCLGGEDLAVYGQCNNNGLEKSQSLSVLADGTVEFAITPDGSTVIGLNTAPSALLMNSWHHIAIVRYGTSLKLHVNGASVASTTYNDPVYSSSHAFTIGRGGDTLNGFNGYIDEFRVTNGLARWTSNFTPPIQAYGLGGVNMTLISNYFVAANAPTTALRAVILEEDIAGVSTYSSSAAGASTWIVSVTADGGSHWYPLTLTSIGQYDGDGGVSSSGKNIFAGSITIGTGVGQIPSSSVGSSGSAIMGIKLLSPTANVIAVHGWALNWL
jgi:hypothetical protein